MSTTAPTRARITETTIGQDRDGDWFAESATGEGATRITHYQGADPRSDADTPEHGDLFTIDAPDPLTCADLAGHIAACRALLDRIDTTGVMRAADRDRQLREQERAA